MKAGTRKLIRILGNILIILYIAFLLYFLIFSDMYGRGQDVSEYRYNLTLFKEIRRFWEHRDMLGWVTYANIVGNVVIFIPFGFLMPVAARKRSIFITVLASFGLSFGVEVYQLLSKMGSFDVDDLFLNTLGGLIGYIIFLIFNSSRRRKNEKRAKKRNGRE